MANDQTGAEFGPQEGVIEAVVADNQAPQFYVREDVTEQIVETRVTYDEDGNPNSEVDTNSVTTTRVYGPYVEFVADQEVHRIHGRHRALGLPGDQTVEKVAADDVDTSTHQETSPGADKPVVTDVLLPDAPESPEVGVEVENTATDVIPDTAAGDAPSYDVTPAVVPQSDQEPVEGNVTNPEFDQPAPNPDVTAPQASIPSAPEEDPNTTDAVTTASTEADDATPADAAPPVHPEAPVGQDNPIVDADSSPAPVDATTPDDVTTVADQPVETPPAPEVIPADAPADAASADVLPEQTPADEQPVTSEDPTPVAPSEQPAVPDDVAPVAEDPQVAPADASAETPTDGAASVPDAAAPVDTIDADQAAFAAQNGPQGNG